MAVRKDVARLVISLQANGTLEAQIWCESQKQIAKVLKANEQEVGKQDVIDGTFIGRNWLCFLVKNRPNEMRILSGRNKSLKMISKEQKRNTSPAILVMHSFSAFFMVEWESDILVNDSHLCYHLLIIYHSPQITGIHLFVMWRFSGAGSPGCLCSAGTGSCYRGSGWEDEHGFYFDLKRRCFLLSRYSLGKLQLTKCEPNMSIPDMPHGAVWGCSNGTFNVTSSSGRDSNWRLSCMSDYRWFEAKSKKWKWNGLRCDGLLGVRDRWWSCHEFGKRVCR